MHILIITLLGVPPSDATPFFNFISSASLNFSNLHYSVLALGDTSYPHFCRAGKDLDARLKTTTKIMQCTGLRQLVYTITRLGSLGAKMISCS